MHAKPLLRLPDELGILRCRHCQLLDGCRFAGDPCEQYTDVLKDTRFLSAFYRIPVEILEVTKSELAESEAADGR